MSHYVDLTGRRFAMWVVLRDAGRDKRKRALWQCLCDCGEERVVQACNLIQGTSKGCGCVGRAKAAERARLRNRKHGHSVRGAMSPTYHSWAAMLARCRYDYEVNKYHHALGVTVCERWTDFEAFLADMGERPSKGHSIDRFPDPAGNYEPGNCRWATATQQVQNRRKKDEAAPVAEPQHPAPPMAEPRERRGRT